MDFIEGNDEPLCYFRRLQKHHRGWATHIKTSGVILPVIRAITYEPQIKAVRQRRKDELWKNVGDRSNCRGKKIKKKRNKIKQNEKWNRRYDCINTGWPRKKGRVQNESHLRVSQWTYKLNFELTDFRYTCETSTEKYQAYGNIAWSRIQECGLAWRHGFQSSSALPITNSLHAEMWGLSLKDGVTWAQGY